MTKWGVLFSAAFVMAGVFCASAEEAAKESPSYKPEGGSFVEVEAKNLHSMDLALTTYRLDNKGAYPDDLGVLLDLGYIKRPDVFIAPGSKTEPPKNGDDVRKGHCDYVYLAKGFTAESLKERPVLFRKPGVVDSAFYNVLEGWGKVVTKDLQAINAYIEKFCSRDGARPK